MATAPAIGGSETKPGEIRQQDKNYVKQKLQDMKTTDRKNDVYKDILNELKIEYKRNEKLQTRISETIDKLKPYLTEEDYNYLIDLKRQKQQQQSDAAKNTAERVVTATNRAETEEEKQKIQETIQEGLEEGKPASKIATDITEEINYNYNDEKKVDKVVKAELKTEKIMGLSVSNPKTKLTEERMTDSITNPKAKLTEERMTDSITNPKPERKLTEQTVAQTAYESRKESEPIIEVSRVSEQEQMRRDEAIPSDFSMPSLNKQMKEGKTTLQELQSKMPSKLQKGEQVLKWVNKVGGYENYEYLRSKFNLVDEVNGDMNYLKKMDDCLVNIYGSDIGVSSVSMTSEEAISKKLYSDMVSLKQCVRELNIMKNCLYITKFKAATGPQYGLIVGLNRMMTMADLLAKPQPMSTQPMPNEPMTNQPMPSQPMPNKPVVKGQERLEYEEQKSQLIERAVQPQEQERRGRRLNPQIKQDNIEQANLNRGYRSMSMSEAVSMHQKVLSGNVAQADVIARGIRLKPAKKQF
jgi:hypothetical protein